MGNSQKDVDVLILGGGPAGLSAALWCVDLGLRAVVVERSTELGGQLLWTHNPILNYLGAAAANGRELRDTFVRQVAGLETEVMMNAQIESADLTNRRLQFKNGDMRSAVVG